MIRFYSVLTAIMLFGMPAARSMGSSPATPAAATWAQPAAENSPVVTATGGSVRGGTLLHMTMPLYPVGAQHAQVSGKVKIEAWIGKDGKVVDTCVISGPNMLRHAAQDAVKRWQYAPTILDGKAIDRIARIELEFLPTAQ